MQSSVSTREERRRHLGRVHPLDELVAADLDLEEVRGTGRRRRRTARRRSANDAGSPVAGPSWRPVRGSTPLCSASSRHLGQVEVAGEDVGLLAEGAHLHAAAAAAGARVLEGLALAQLLLHDGVGVEERREAVALGDHPQGVLQDMRPGSCARAGCWCWAGAGASRPQYPAGYGTPRWPHSEPSRSRPPMLMLAKSV